MYHLHSLSLRVPFLLSSLHLSSKVAAAAAAHQWAAHSLALSPVRSAHSSIVCIPSIFPLFKLSSIRLRRCAFNSGRCHAFRFVSFRFVCMQRQPFNSVWPYKIYSIRWVVVSLCSVVDRSARIARVDLFFLQNHFWSIHFWFHITRRVVLRQTKLLKQKYWSIRPQSHRFYLSKV